MEQPDYLTSTCRYDRNKVELLNTESMRVHYVVSKIEFMSHRPELYLSWEIILEELFVGIYPGFCVCDHFLRAYRFLEVFVPVDIHYVCEDFQVFQRFFLYINVQLVSDSFKNRVELSLVSFRHLPRKVSFQELRTPHHTLHPIHKLDRCFKQGQFVSNPLRRMAAQHHQRYDSHLSDYRLLTCLK